VADDENYTVHEKMGCLMVTCVLSSIVNVSAADELRVTAAVTQVERVLAEPPRDFDDGCLAWVKT
jgi:hypothetical protein